MVARAAVFLRAHRGLKPVYNAAAVEEKWRALVSTRAKSAGSSSPPQHYTLAMFPYPSGSLHMGHVRVYTLGDALARFERLQGKEVVYPMGWDAFGLPAENAAVERGLRPSQWTESNIDSMRKQLDQLGLCLDWDREVVTCRPDYYRWTQWLFLQLYQRGLAYRAEAEVNWDPIDKTVLANEQVDGEGRSWRSGAIVERRTLKQWFFKITNYADELLESLPSLTGWPESVKDMQQHWIGRSEGAHISFPIESKQDKESLVAAHLPITAVQAFTTRPETLYGVTFLAVASNHPLAEMAHKVVARHPLTKEAIPVVVGRHVVADYGTGVVMGVPGHDERDATLAHDLGLPIRTVLNEENRCIDSGPLDGLATDAARAEVLKLLEQAGSGEGVVNYRLRDWLVSRQRYWGTPIPIIHCGSCGEVPVPEAELPVHLPDDTTLDLSKAEGAPLASADAAWLHPNCPKCGQKASRDTDTLDTFVDSSWYYLRHLDPDNSETLCSSRASEAMPVDVYIGGVEHAVLHLLYARFICKFLADEGITKVREPFSSLLTQGLVQGRTHKSAEDGRYLRPAEIDVLKDEKGAAVHVEKRNGRPTVVTWEKMSKSKHNGIAPEDIVREHGADVARAFVLFKAPPELDLEWDDAAITGVSRWLNRLWSLVQPLSEMEPEQFNVRPATPQLDLELNSKLNETIARVTQAFGETRSLNVAVAALMELSNFLRSHQNSKGDSVQMLDSIRMLLVMLYPIAPHMASELWSGLQPLPSTFGKANDSLDQQLWPQPNLATADVSTMTIAIQIGGRVRGKITLSAEQATDVDAVLEAVLASDFGLKHIESRQRVKKVFIAPNGKVASVVVNNAN